MRFWHEEFHRYDEKGGARGAASGQPLAVRHMRLYKSSCPQITQINTDFVQKALFESVKIRVICGQ
jgi:hypothetical protein